MDFETAYLNARLPAERTVYVRLPKGFGRDGYVLRLVKALYGVKDAARAWSLELALTLTTTAGFKRSLAEPCLYYRLDDGGRLACVLLVHVDDVLVASPTPAGWRALLQHLQSRYRVKDLGFPTTFLGFQIVRRSDGLFLHQATFVDALLAKYKYTDCRKVLSPGIPRRGGGHRHQNPTRATLQRICGGTTLAGSSHSSRRSARRLRSG